MAEEKSEIDLRKIKNPIVRRALERRCDGFIFSWLFGEESRDKHNDRGGYDQWKKNPLYSDADYEDYDDHKEYLQYKDGGGDWD